LTGSKEKAITPFSNNLRYYQGSWMPKNNQC
jgi:hypothetical protein